MKTEDSLKQAIELLKEDFEMLQNGSWDLNYSDGSEIEASLDNIVKLQKGLSYYIAYSKYIESVHNDIHKKAIEWADIDKMINEM